MQSGYYGGREHMRNSLLLSSHMLNFIGEGVVVFAILAIGV